MDMMSRKVSPSEQGQLQGANSSSRSVAGLLGPAVFTATFAWLLHWLPGAPFLLAALLLVAAAAVAWIVTAPTPDAGRARVSLQTSQSGFSGLLNHGSAQPRSRQRRTMAAATSWPSRSNSGSLPPGWVSPRRRYRISGRVGRSPSNSLSFNAKTSSERASWRTIWRSANTAASPSDDAGKGLSPNPSFDEKPGKIRWLPPFPATST